MAELLGRLVREVMALRPREGDPKLPSAVWTEPDVMRGTNVEALTVILRTRGCTWALRAGCTMCGYPQDSFIRKVDPQDLVTQFRAALASWNGQEMVKIYTSGSFPDPTEVPSEAQRGILGLIPKGVARVVVETQAGYLTTDTAASLRAALDKDVELEFALGLESANPRVLAHAVNKDYTFEDFAAAADAAHAAGCRVKCYLLVKPPFVAERDALEDCVESAKRVAPFSDDVSFNATNVQNGTLVERLWRRGEYRSPWLWTCLDILRRSAFGAPAVGGGSPPTSPRGPWLKCEPVGAGQQRGAHNCGTCDKAVTAAIMEFTRTQDPLVLEGLDCACREEWMDVLELEGFTMSAVPL